MRLDAPVLLITGVTGLVGGELLKLLLPAKRGRCIGVLSRRREKIVELNLLRDVAALQGDIAHPDLGLDDRACAELKGSLREVIHCAADTRFGLPLECARSAFLGKIVQDLYPKLINSETTGSFLSHAYNVEFNASCVMITTRLQIGL
jgi:hypothetical protein